MQLLATDLKKRSAKDSTTTTAHGEQWSRSDSNPTYYFVGDRYHDKTYSHREFYGWDIPNYHARVKARELLPHTNFWCLEVQGSVDGAYHVKRVWPDTSWSETKIEGHWSPHTEWIITEEDFDPYTPSGALDVYAQEAAASIYSNSWDALTFVAELADVRHLFVNTAKKVMKLQFPTNWRSLSNDWLSSRYGWRTLIYDISDINQVIRNYNKKRRTRFSESKGDTSTQTVTSVTENNAESFYTREITVVDKVTTALRGSVTADIEIPAISVNPVVTAWEIIPFSFVIDWFLSVGKSIAASSFLLAEQAYSASYGYCVTIERSFSLQPTNPTAEVTTLDIWSEGTCKGVKKVRVPCSVPYTPHLSFNINPFKILDLLGLIIQRARR